MSDNILIDPGTTPSIPVASEDIDGNQYQKIKLVDSTDDSTDPIGVAANPLQVSLENTGENTTPLKVDGSATTQPVSGTVTANLGTIADVATQTTLAALSAKVTACNTGAVTISGALPAGSNAIGKLAANSGVDIGDVDVTSLPSVTLASQASPFSSDVNVSLNGETVALAAGSNNIGDVDVLTLPNVTLASQANPFSTDINVSLNGETVVLAAGNNNIGDVDVAALPNVTLASQSSPFTDDVNVSLDGESVVLGSSTASIGKVSQSVTKGSFTITSGSTTPVEINLNDDASMVLILELVADSGSWTSGTIAVYDEAEVLPYVAFDKSGIANNPIEQVEGRFYVLLSAANSSKVHIVPNAPDDDINISWAAYQNYPLPFATISSALGALSFEISGSLPSGTNNLGTVGIDQINANANEVVIKSALPAGTNAIGKLSANSGVDIGDVDVTSLPALAAGTNVIGAVKRDTVNYTPVRKYYSNTGAVTDGIVWSPASGKKWAITDISLSVSAAATVTFEDDKAGGDAVVMAWDLAANGGVTINFQTPLLSEEADADLIVTTSAGNIKCVVSGYEF